MFSTTPVHAIYIIIAAFWAHNAFAEMGPLNLDFLDAGVCDPIEYISLDLSSLDETQRAFTVNITVPFDLDSSVSYSLVVDKIENGEVQEGVFKKAGPDFCNDIEKFVGAMWIKIAEAMGMNDDCPKLAGSYFVEDHPIDYDDIKIEQFLYGHFIANIFFHRLGEDIACLYVEFTNTESGESAR